MKPKNIKKYIEYLFDNIDCRVGRYPFGIVVAGSFQNACTSAEINWGWRRTLHNGRKGWESPCGRIFYYVGTVAGLHGLANGTPLKIGFGKMNEEMFQEIKYRTLASPPFLQLSDINGTVKNDR